MTEKFIEAYDAASETVLTRGEAKRRHLGASSLGAHCAREIWYGFRKFETPPPEARMRRLWQRGHEEEFQFVKYLRAMGVEVRDYSERLMYHGDSDSYTTLAWDANDEEPGVMSTLMECDDVSDDAMHIRRATEMGQGPEQWHFSTHNGHHEGSSDGQLLIPAEKAEEWFPEKKLEGWGQAEFKTHNLKSFDELSKKGVRQSKFGHFIQMQTYMHHFKLRWALYLAVCKNDDRIYAEIVMYDAGIAEKYLDRAGAIIEARVAPSRVTKDPSWFGCRFCDFKQTCHYSKPANKNCRTCAFSEATVEGNWYCNYHKGVLPRKFEEKGCDNWEEVST